MPRGTRQSTHRASVTKSGKLTITTAGAAKKQCVELVLRPPRCPDSRSTRDAGRSAVYRDRYGLAPDNPVVRATLRASEL